MIPVTQELVDAHRQDLMAAAKEQRRGRGEAVSPLRRHVGRWMADHIA